MRGSKKNIYFPISLKFIYLSAWLVEWICLGINYRKINSGRAVKIWLKQLKPLIFIKWTRDKKGGGGGFKIPTGEQGIVQLILYQEKSSSYLKKTSCQKLMINIFHITYTYFLICSFWLKMRRGFVSFNIYLQKTNFPDTIDVFQESWFSIIGNHLYILFSPTENRKNSYLYCIKTFLLYKFAKRKFSGTKEDIIKLLLTKSMT